MGGRSRRPPPPKLAAPSILRPKPLVELSPGPKVTFLDLPAEIRIQIYKLCLVDVAIKIVQPDAATNWPQHHQHHHYRRPPPLPLARTSRQVRSEVLPLVHAMCPIHCEVRNFDFNALLLWTSRIPPDQEVHLAKNAHLSIAIAATEAPRNLNSLRRWLRMRADPHRPQPRWVYSSTGHQPGSKVCADMRRRVKRMGPSARQSEMLLMLRSIGISLSDGTYVRDSRNRGG